MEEVSFGDVVGVDLPVEGFVQAKQTFGTFLERCGCLYDKGVVDGPDLWGKGFW